MENTSNYLQKEVDQVEQKIEDAKQMLMRELNLNIQDYAGDSIENRLIEKEIREVEEDEELDEEEEEGDMQYRSGKLEEDQIEEVDEEGETQQELEQQDEPEDYSNIDELAMHGQSQDAKISLTTLSNEKMRHNSVTSTQFKRCLENA